MSSMGKHTYHPLVSTSPLGNGYIFPWKVDQKWRPPRTSSVATIFGRTFLGKMWPSLGFGRTREIIPKYFLLLPRQASVTAENTPVLFLSYVETWDNIYSIRAQHTHTHTHTHTLKGHM